MCYSPELTEEDLKPLGIIKVEDLQATVDKLVTESESIIVVPEGPYVVGVVEE